MAGMELGAVLVLQVLSWLVPSWTSLWDRFMFDAVATLSWIWVCEWWWSRQVYD